MGNIFSRLTTHNTFKKWNIGWITFKIVKYFRFINKDKSLFGSD